MGYGYGDWVEAVRLYLAVRSPTDRTQRIWEKAEILCACEGEKGATVYTHA